MICKTRHPALVSILLVLSACSADNPIGVVSKYYILNNHHDDVSMRDYSTFTTCEMPAISVAKSTARNDFEGEPGGDRYCDITADEKAMYAGRLHCDTIDVIDYKTFSVTNKLSLGGNFGLPLKKLLTIEGNKIFVAMTAPLSGIDFEAFFKVINLEHSGKVDSIPVSSESEIWAITSANGKIFVSIGDLYPAPKIVVYDAQNYDLLGTIDLQGKCSELYTDGDNMVMAATFGKIVFIDSNTLAITNTKQTDATALSIVNDYFPIYTSYAFNWADNMMYFCQLAPQPATAPHILCSYNLKTDEIKRFAGNFISASTISYDEKQKLILVGSDGKLSLYKTTGEVFTEFPAASTPSKIVVRYSF